MKDRDNFYYLKFRALMLNANEDLTEQEIAEAWEAFAKSIIEVEHHEEESGQRKD